MPLLMRICPVDNTEYYLNVCLFFLVGLTGPQGPKGKYDIVIPWKKGTMCTIVLLRMLAAPMNTFQ